MQGTSQFPPLCDPTCTKLALQSMSRRCKAAPLLHLWRQQLVNPGQLSGADAICAQ